MITTTLALLMLAQEGEVQRTETPRPQARSMTITKLGIVATNQTLAATAGAKVLEAGGNAIDAAIAANAAEGLMEPNANGIGGDLFAIVYEAKTKKIYALNSSGWALTGLDVGLLESKGIKKLPNLGIYSVTIPEPWPAGRHYTRSSARSPGTSSSTRPFTMPRMASRSPRSSVPAGRPARRSSRCRRKAKAYTCRAARSRKWAKSSRIRAWRRPSARSKLKAATASTGARWRRRSLPNQSAWAAPSRWRISQSFNRSG